MKDKGLVSEVFHEHSLASLTGNMGVALDDAGSVVGTGCYDGNHITGVYVHPAFQGRGCGTLIIDRLEEEIAADYDVACIDASLPAACLYEHRGYKTVGHGVIELDEGVKLVYEKMEKQHPLSAWFAIMCTN